MRVSCWSGGPGNPDLPTNDRARKEMSGRQGRPLIFPIRVRFTRLSVSNGLQLEPDTTTREARARRCTGESMVWIVVLGLGWIIGLAGVTAAVTSGLLERGGRRPPVHGRPRWLLLWLILTPACGAHCGKPRELPPPGDGCGLRGPVGTPGGGAECAVFTSQTVKTPS